MKINSEAVHTRALLFLCGIVACLCVSPVCGVALMFASPYVGIELHAGRVLNGDFMLWRHEGWAFHEPTCGGGKL